MRFCNKRPKGHVNPRFIPGHIYREHGSGDIYLCCTAGIRPAGLYNLGNGNIWTLDAPEERYRGRADWSFPAGVGEFTDVTDKYCFTEVD